MDEGRANQRVEQFWETPSHDQIVGISKSHVVALEATDADEVWVQVGMHHIVLHTIGRRSGEEHKCALPVWRDDNGHRIVVGSFAGAEKEPDWVLNLRDRDANPRVRVRSQSGFYWSDHRFLKGDAHAVVWQQLCADRAWYGDYQDLTERRIPLIRLVETELIVEEL
ncbi:MAG: nitroreductase/quinone reductase family protein [Actinomycetota bacterium]|nr:nitroreductase/quinone reductase family protein [Actinomycetota bacterium]